MKESSKFSHLRSWTFDIVVKKWKNWKNIIIFDQLIVSKHTWTHWCCILQVWQVILRWWESSSIQRRSVLPTCSEFSGKATTRLKVWPQPQILDSHDQTPEGEWRDVTGKIKSVDLFPQTGWNFILFFTSLFFDLMILYWWAPSTTMV